MTYHVYIKTDPELVPVFDMKVDADITTSEVAEQSCALFEEMAEDIFLSSGTYYVEVIDMKSGFAKNYTVTTKTEVTYEAVLGWE